MSLRDTWIVSGLYRLSRGEKKKGDKRGVKDWGGIRRAVQLPDSFGRDIAAPCFGTFHEAAKDYGVEPDGR